jgi:hypothetical protein
MTSDYLLKIIAALLAGILAAAISCAINLKEINEDVGPPTTEEAR